MRWIGLIILGIGCVLVYYSQGFKMDNLSLALVIGIIFMVHGILIDNKLNE